MTKTINVCDHCAGRGYVPEPFTGDTLVMCPGCGGIGRTEPRSTAARDQLLAMARQLREMADVLEAAAWAGEPHPTDLVDLGDGGDDDPPSAA